MCAGKAPWPLFIHGPAGVGKTCAGLLLCDYAVNADYFSVIGLTERLLQAIGGRLSEFYPEAGKSIDVTPEKLWERLRGRSVVVLDELGSRTQVSDFHYETVKRLLDLRENRPFVVLSNLDLGKIATIYDDRVASRLGAGTVVKLLGDDRRLKK